MSPTVKKVIIAAVVIIGAVMAYRYWQARQAPAADASAGPA